MNTGKNITKLALIGAGAVGAYFITGYEKLKEDNPGKVSFTVIAEGARKEKLQKDGILINGVCYHPAVMTAEEAGPQDVILIATKYQGLDSAIAMLPPMIKEDTMVLSLLNGVDSEEKIAATVGKEHVVYSLMRISSEHKNGEIRYRDLEPYMGVFYGVTKEQLSEVPESEAVAMPIAANACSRLCDLFEAAGLLHHCMDDILADMWGKYAANVSNNLPQAILGASANLYLNSEHGHWMAENLWKEVALVAAKKGIRLSEKPVIWDIPGARYSTLQDIDAGRPTEIDMLAGTLMRLAEEVGVEVPYTTYTFHLIKALEEKNHGLFS